MATATSIADQQLVTKRAQVVFQILVLALLLGLLANYKGASQVTKIRQVRATGTLHLAALPIDNGKTSSAALINSVAYLRIVWPALVFGVLISAAARTSLWGTPLYKIFDGSKVRDQLAAVLAGAPLMLCSCCAAPIFAAVYQRTRKVAPALGLTLASPSLNPAALTLSFILFPWRIATARLAMALLLVLAGCIVVARIVRPPAPLPALAHRPTEHTWGRLLTHYAKSVGHISLGTVPPILLGIWISMWVMNRLSFTGMAEGGRLVAIIAVALFAVLLTLPTFFEIPLALSILAAGGPAGAAAALLFAGPAINLSSLLVIGRYSSWKLAFALAILVWGIAASGGLLLG